MLNVYYILTQETYQRIHENATLVLLAIRKIGKSGKSQRIKK